MSDAVTSGWHPAGQRLLAMHGSGTPRHAPPPPVCNGAARGWLARFCARERDSGFHRRPACLVVDEGMPVNAQAQLSGVDRKAPGSLCSPAHVAEEVHDVQSMFGSSLLSLAQDTPFINEFVDVMEMTLPVQACTVPTSCSALNPETSLGD